MKKIFALGLAVALGISTLGFTVVADETESAEVEQIIDLSGYSDEEIEAILKQVNQEIVDRNIEKTADLVPGVYTAGKDFPAGSYIVTVDKANEDDSGQVTAVHYNSENQEDYTELMDDYIGMSDNGETYSVSFQDGDQLGIQVNCKLTISAGVKFD